jgi:hypothetical protein
MRQRARVLRGYLRTAAPETVKRFFDDLAKRKRVFEPFMAVAS